MAATHRSQRPPTKKPTKLSWPVTHGIKFSPGKGASWSADAASVYGVSAVLMVVNMPPTVPPRVFTIVMIAIEMPAAIRAYSMAVAPASSAKNFVMMLLN